MALSELEIAPVPEEKESREILIFRGSQGNSWACSAVCGNREVV